MKSWSPGCVSLKYFRKTYDYTNILNFINTETAESIPKVKAQLENNIWKSSIGFNLIQGVLVLFKP